MNNMGIQENQVPQPKIELSLPGKVVVGTLGTGIEMAKTWAIASAFGYPFQWLGICDRETRINQTAFAVLSVPIRNVASYSLHHLLGCNEDTPVKNLTKEIATQATSLVAGGLAASYLGYPIDIHTLFKYNVVLPIAMLGGIFTTSVAITVVASCFMDVEEANEGEEIEDMEDIEEFQEDLKEAKTIDADRVKLFSDTSAVKTEQAKQLVLNAA